VKTGLFSKLVSAFALFGAALAPAATAHAATLEEEFELAFTAPAHPAAPKAETRIVPKPAARPVVQSRAQPGTIQPFIASTAPAPAGGRIEAQIASLANASAGRIGVAAIDLTSGRSLAVMGDTPFPMASTVKIAIVATFLDGVDQGRFRLDQQFPLMVPVRSKRFSSAVAPVVAGRLMSARDLIDRALIHSDNQATDALLAVIGGPQAVNRWLRGTGNPGLRIDRDIATLVRDDGRIDPARTIDQRDSATPMAMARLLAGLYQGRWLSTQSRSVLLGTMERCVTGKYRMRAQLPAEARIAHKTGTLANTSSDVGLIQTPDGRVYVVAVYVTGQGGHANRDARIARITRAIYDGYQTDASGYRSVAQR